MTPSRGLHESEESKKSLMHLTKESVSGSRLFNALQDQEFSQHRPNEEWSCENPLVGFSKRTLQLDGLPLSSDNLAVLHNQTPRC